MAKTVQVDRKPMVLTLAQPKASRAGLMTTPPPTTAQAARQGGRKADDHKQQRLTNRHSFHSNFVFSAFIVRETEEKQKYESP